MSRNGWRDAREEDYLALERELREIDKRINWDRERDNAWIESFGKGEDTK